MAHETRHLDLSEMVNMPAVDLVEQVRKTRQTTIIRADGEDAVEIRPARKRRQRLPRGQGITAADKLWSIVGSIDDPEGPTDISGNVDAYLAETHMPRPR
jgi:hypothetical protein